MKRLALLAAPLAARGSFVYRATALNHRTDELVENEAIGWAVPVRPMDRRSGPRVWFSTDLGSEELNIGPRSELGQTSLLKVSLDDQTNLLVVKVMEPFSVVDAIKEWPLADQAVDWETDTVMRFSGQDLVASDRSVLFDLTTHDIGFSSREGLAMFQNAWSYDLVRDHNSRLVVSCDELKRRNGVSGFDLKLRDVAISVKELVDVDSELVELRSSGWCPMNVVFDAVKPTIGRTILEDYDLVLDGTNRRITLVAKGDQRPNRRLMKYRLDRESPVNPDVNSWRWIPSRGRVRLGDFVFQIFAADVFRFRVFCITKLCEDDLIQAGTRTWVGEPAIEVLSSSAITVSEKIRGWRGYQLVTIKMSNVVGIVIQSTGYRMRRDLSTSKSGEHMELIPVEGPKQIGELSIPKWPPVFRDATVQIERILSEDADALLDGNTIWRGTPKFEVLAGNKIVITATSSQLACDRSVGITHLSHSTFLDFRTETCKYRQIGSWQTGYFFEPLARAETSADYLTISTHGLAKNFDAAEDTYTLISSTRSENVWSPSIVWPAAPALVLDPDTRAISIQPTGEAPWPYSHEWVANEEGGVSLVFKSLNRKLKIPRRLRLSDNVWEFGNGDSDAEGPTVSIQKGAWLDRQADGTISLKFEEVTSQVFYGPKRRMYVGFPDISFDDFGNLHVRSNGDPEFRFVVEVSEPAPGKLEVEFTPLEFDAVETGADDERCPICYEDYTRGELVAETPCRHRFHIKCLRRVEERRCPLCRSSLDQV